MHLTSFLSPKDIIFEKRALNHQQVYETMVDRLVHNYRLPKSKTEILELLNIREKQSPTAYPNGLAMPHIRLQDFEDIVLSFCFLQYPIEISGMKISWLVFIITDDKGSALYLNIVSALLKLSGNADNMKTLLSCTDANAIYSALQKLNLDVQQELHVQDVMCPEPYSISPDATMRELIGEMNKHQVAGLPVIDSAGKYMGEINILDILKVGVPDYIMMMEDLNFLHSFEPLEKLFEKQDTVRVKEIMRVDETCLRPGDSMMEAVFAMMQGHKRYISVVEDGKLKGVITAMDIFRKVISS